MRLLLIRHGESTWNAEGRYQGRLDAPLSTLGRAQAEALAARLRREQSETPIDQRIARIITSPLARARDTAQICAQALSISIDIDDRLTEISHGEWEGKLAAEVANRWPEVLAAWRSTPHLVRFPGGESLDDVHARFGAFLREMQDGPHTLLVTHDVIVRIAVLRANASPLSSFNQVDVDNAALSEFLLEKGILKLVRLDDTSHLGSLRSNRLTQAL